jgi:hypothetical protein
MLDANLLVQQILGVGPRTPSSLEFVRAVKDGDVTYLSTGRESARSAFLTFLSRLHSVTSSGRSVRGIAHVTEALRALPNDAIVVMHHFMGTHLKCTVFALENEGDVIGCICIDRRFPGDAGSQV